MSLNFNYFIHFIFMGIIALFPVINPIGSSLIVNTYFSQLSPATRKKAVRRVIFYAFCICVASLLVGHWILELFGISIPIIQLAGGIMICKIGWEFLSAGPSKINDNTPDIKLQLPDEQKEELIKNQLFYPIAFPMTTGAGTISVIFTLSAHNQAPGLGNYLFSLGALLISISVVLALTYVLFSNADKLIHFMGSSGGTIMNRIMAFFIFCVGLQIAYGGIELLVKSMMH